MKKKKRGAFSKSYQAYMASDDYKNAQTLDEFFFGKPKERTLVEIIGKDIKLK